MMGRGPHFRAGIRDGHGEAAIAKDAQIRKIVRDASDLVGLPARLAQKSLVSRGLVGDSLEDTSHADFLGSSDQGLGTSAAEYDGLLAGSFPCPEAGAVSNVEEFELIVIAVDDSPVCEHPIDIEDQRLDWVATI
jgi:hypothetical protein